MDWVTTAAIHSRQCNMYTTHRWTSRLTSEVSFLSRASVHFCFGIGAMRGGQGWGISPRTNTNLELVRGARVLNCWNNRKQVVWGDQEATRHLLRDVLCHYTGNLGQRYAETPARAFLRESNDGVIGSRDYCIAYSGIAFVTWSRFLKTQLFRFHR